MLLLVVAAAVLAGVEVTVQALALAVQQEFEGLEAVDAVGFIEVGLIRQKLSLAALLVDLAFQLPAENIPKQRNLVSLAFHCKLSCGKCCHHFRNNFLGKMQSPSACGNSCRSNLK